MAPDQVNTSLQIVTRRRGKLQANGHVDKMMATHDSSDTDENNNLKRTRLDDDTELFKRIIKRTRNESLTSNGSPLVKRQKAKLQTTVKKVLKYIEFGEWRLKTLYLSPFPEEYSKATTLYFCEFCLAYKKSKSFLKRHLLKCQYKNPPGNEIYRDKDLSVFEVDGASDKKYCESLCLISKLFLDNKTLFYDVDLFLFYILTTSDSKGSHLIGYFSKQKYDADLYNLSCILTLPQYQRAGYGSFLIGFSYMLSRLENKLGTPEKPLSALGRLSYLSYWKAAVKEYIYKHKDELHISIKQISLGTGMIFEDVVLALRLLNFLKVQLFEKDRQFAIALNWKQINATAQRIKFKIPIKEENLKWMPLYIDNNNNDVNSL